MSNIKVLLGQKIKEIRKSRKITQEQLAEKIGVGTPNISYIETGKFAPSIENFEKIAKTLGVEPYELYMFSPQKTSGEMTEEMLNAFKNDEKLLKLVYKFFITVK